MTRILHLSDPHFGTEQADVMNALLQLVREQRPSLALLSGDITQRARPQQFRQARRFMTQLGIPILAVPGNHDMPLFNPFKRLLRPYGHYQDNFAADLEPLLETDCLLVVGVNSSRPDRHKNGELTSAQIQRVEHHLQRASASQLRIVMQHHPVRAVESSDRSNLLIGGDQVVPRWVDAGLDLLLAGHIHLPYVRPLNGQHSTRRAWTAQAGTALSSRVRGEVPNSVNLIEHSTDGPFHTCAIARWDYVDTSRSFRLYSHTDLALDRSG
ncbi:metallophosphoesterase family protein [Halopseudomonas maritima]|uniref:metallophosphoesterase family protein n=1 Tax=Halopseudomonas maritima TaxID=2918528 RepID=UPI001EEC7585|nr:metallophosphoesterase [Halopseudomonas maritima]UJJ30402.1 metallophosphoesterase [Halopseudomonas maritima]